MNLTKALNAVANGAPSIVSVLGKRYTAEELQPRMIGGHAAVFKDVGMTKAEREGDFFVPIPRNSSGRLYREAMWWNLYGGDIDV